ncbi:MAG: VC_2705 family sodium/solute symporter, partial [Gammaproteobacteria bacterium AqS3]|nr:VC_2705 family sodium/solute symporter [Gammaproteobacteria bacterium AqS3]
FAITAALMIGTAGLPHVIVRFFTVPRARAARTSAAWALIFIALLYTTAPAVGAFSRLALVDEVNETAYSETPDWLRSWEDIGLIAWVDKNEDGAVQYRGGPALADGSPVFAEGGERGENGERLLQNTPSDGDNELYIDRDILVLAMPEIADLPAWVMALVAAGALAAALSTAAGLLLVISTSISHDLLKRTFVQTLSDRQELLCARVAAASVICLAGYMGINPPAFVAQVVAFAFGLAAATLFPPILLGIFTRLLNQEGAIAGMLTGLVFTAGYIVFFKFVSPELNTTDNWLLGISPEGIGLIGALLNIAVGLGVSRFTAPVPEDVQEMITRIRMPGGEGEVEGGA